MIKKVAQVQALREAFPAQLGAMYTAEEQGVIDIPHEDVSAKVNREKAENANKQTISIDDIQQPNVEQQPEARVGQPGGLFAGTAAKANEAKQTGPGF
jgi:hypothetical protein